MTPDNVTKLKSRGRLNQDQLRTIIAAAFAQHDRDPAATWQSLDAEQRYELETFHIISEFDFVDAVDRLQDAELRRMVEEGYPSGTKMPALDAWLFASAVMAESWEKLTAEEAAWAADRSRRRARVLAAEAEMLRRALAERCRGDTPDPAA